MNFKNREGKVNIGILGIIFVILLVCAIFGKTSFWHVVFFPFYVVGGCFGLFLGVVLLIVALLFIVFLCQYFSK